MGASQIQMNDIRLQAAADKQDDGRCTIHRRGKRCELPQGHKGACTVRRIS